MKTLHLVHNIPAPYRIHFFNILSHKLEESDVRLFVHFLGVNNPDRPSSWMKSLEKAEFEFKIWKGRNFRFNGGFYWFNPSLIAYLFKTEVHYFVQCGLWDNFTSMVLSFLPISRKKFCWLELNVNVEGKKSKFIKKLKVFFLKRYRGFFVPGKSSDSYIINFLDSSLLEKRSYLPNLVDEKKFTGDEPKTNTLPLEIDNFFQDNKRIAYLPARLIPKKGICEYLGKTSELFIKFDIKLLIIGEGELQQEVEAVIAKRKMEENCLLLRPIDYDLVSEVYEKTTFFLLPSFEDPNPLSVIEALHSGLPLLISNRLGNAQEALKEGINGFSFDPDSESEVVEKTKKILSLSESELKIMGEESKHIGREKWGSDIVVSEFVKKIIS